MRARATSTNHGLRSCPWPIHTRLGRGGSGHLEKVPSPPRARSVSSRWCHTARKQGSKPLIRSSETFCYSLGILVGMGSSARAQNYLFRYPECFFFAAEWRLFHFPRTSVIVRFQNQWRWRPRILLISLFIPYFRFPALIKIRPLQNHRP